MTVADTDVLIDALRGSEPVATRIGRELRARTLATTAVSAFELLSGARTEGEQNKVGLLLAALTVLEFDERAAEAASAARRALEKAGRGIGMADYLIAGICIARDAPLLTRNREHFERIPGLVLGEI